MNVRIPLTIAAVACAALIAVGSALAHAEVLPDEAVAGQAQLFALAVPNEKSNASTTKVVLRVPDGFQIIQFAASPGWTRKAVRTGSGEDTRVTVVTWTAAGGGDPEGGLFQFTGQAESTGTYIFEVEQDYSDRSYVNWEGDEDSETPAAVVEVTGSAGGGGSSTLAIVALVVGGIAVVLACIALATRGARPVA